MHIREEKYQDFKINELINITKTKKENLYNNLYILDNHGFIYGFGSNVFKLAGSVLLYGIVAAVTMAMIRYLLGGVA